MRQKFSETKSPQHTATSPVVNFGLCHALTRAGCYHTERDSNGKAKIEGYTRVSDEQAHHWISLTCIVCPLNIQFRLA